MAHHLLVAHFKLLLCRDICNELLLHNEQLWMDRSLLCNAFVGLRASLASGDKLTASLLSDDLRAFAPLPSFLSEIVNNSLDLI